jgi:protein involved in ribonucleotide reduction
MGGLFYYSSETGNTRRFVERLGLPASRIAASPKEHTDRADRPYVLVVPTYSDGAGRGSVAKGVIRFLGDEDNRRLIRGVIGAGNRNFGEYYCHAAKAVAERCGVPLLYRFELMGMPEDVSNVRAGLERFWGVTQ